jgi:hypothetical protein
MAGRHCPETIPTNRTGFDELQKAPNIAAAIRITTISQKIADINTAMARNAAEFILGRCIYGKRGRQWEILTGIAMVQRP